MVPLVIASALALLTLDETPATSQAAAAAPAEVGASHQTDASQDPARVICKGEAVTGSRFQKRTCLTRAEWAELQRRREYERDKFERHLGENAGLPALAPNPIGAN
jgi:hypothetical protein